MSFRYIEDVATADIAFEATGEDREEVFFACAQATMNVMIEDLDSIEPAVAKSLHLENRDLDMLLFDLLQELIYYKDAEQLLLRIEKPAIADEKSGYVLRATAKGEKLDPRRHRQRADVKAVTLHRFALAREADGRWKAFVILDV